MHFFLYLIGTVTAAHATTFEDIRDLLPSHICMDHKDLIEALNQENTMLSALQSEKTDQCLMLENEFHFLQNELNYKKDQFKTCQHTLQVLGEKLQEMERSVEHLEILATRSKRLHESKILDKCAIETAQICRDSVETHLAKLAVSVCDSHSQINALSSSTMVKMTACHSVLNSTLKDTETSVRQAFHAGLHGESTPSQNMSNVRQEQ